MLTSSCTANRLIDRVIGELGYAAAPDRAFFYDVLNDCLAQIYTETVVERRRLPATAEDGCLRLSSLTPPEGCAPIRGADLFCAWSGDRQLRFLPTSVLPLGGKGYCAVEDDRLILGDVSDGEALSAEVILRPARFSEENGENCIPFPDEFLALLACRLRGEALRLSGEDGEAAKWLGEYNTRLTEFHNRYTALRVRRKEAYEHN